MNRETKFVLFDIDGTLIDSGGAGARALNRALDGLTGIANGFRGIDFAGKTDLQIIQEGLDRLGFQSQNGLFRSLIDRYLQGLRAEVPRSRGHIKPGVQGLLQGLRDREGISIGLLTGNLEEGARIKLDPFGLNTFFPIGAFGSDDPDRNRLLPIAVERFFEREGISVPYRNCIVIGDTPRDVTCAHAHGGRCLAVATGPYTVEELQRTEPDLVLPDLISMDRIISWIEET